MCQECDFLYCGICFDTFHPSKGPLAAHTTGPAGARRQKRKEENLLCERHREEKPALYCCECKTPICYKCKEHGQHKGHEIELLDPLFRNTKVHMVAAFSVLIQRFIFMTDAVYFATLRGVQTYVAKET